MIVDNNGLTYYEETDPVNMYGAVTWQKKLSNYFHVDQ